MNIKFLGTGTSHGVPLIGCRCKICVSTDQKNKRYRTSVYLQDNNTSILIDTPAEFRLRALEYSVKQIDAVLITHCHADHVAGLDDIRRYNELQGGVIPLYSSRQPLAEIRSRFNYIFDKTAQEGGGKPALALNEIRPYEKFRVKNLEIIPLLLKHGVIDVLGFRIGDAAYLTDVSAIPEKTYEYLKGLKVLVLDALRREPHPTHFSLGQAVSEAEKINAGQTYFTHISHSMEYSEVNAGLPDNISLAYDGQEIQL